MYKTSISAVEMISLLLGDEDRGIGVPRPLPGHVEDRLASMGAGAARAQRRKFSRRRES
jgi:hypothetical protein